MNKQNNETEFMDLQELVLNNISNDVFDFKELIKQNNTLIWKNCHNLKLIIGSTVSKFNL